MHYLNLAALMESVKIKVKILYKRFVLKKMDKTPPDQLWLSQATESFTGLVEAESSYHAGIP